MKIGDLEKGIPPPTAGVQRYELVLKNVSRMEVGHSFTITLEDGEKVTARGIGRIITKAYKLTDKIFKCSTVSQGRQIRIWRLK
jgi:hypothetical protein